MPSASSWKAVTMKIAAGTTFPIVLYAEHIWLQGLLTSERQVLLSVVVGSSGK